jgi:plasmid stabilization system protein ParE
MMRIVIHPAVHSDVLQIMEYYESVADPELAAEFYRELRSFFDKAGMNPYSFQIIESNLRRVNLDRFPYHFLYKIADDAVRILVVRHHHRHPSTGRER